MSHFTLKPKGNHIGTIIWMHGLGDSHQGFSGLFQQIQSEIPGIKVILPDAPNMPITCNGGAKMRGWYDITSIDGRRVSGEGGLKEASKAVIELLDKETQIISPSKIIIGGFSQGGAMAIYSGFPYSKKLGGIVACSGYVLDGLLNSEIPTENKDIPFLVFHGEHDGVVPYKFAMESYKELQSKHSIPKPEIVVDHSQGHEITYEEIKKLTQHFKKMFS